MKPRRIAVRLSVAFLLGTTLPVAASAETGILVVHVKDVQRNPISGILLGVSGDAGTALTANDGKARIRLGRDTRDGSWISLQIVKCPPHRALVMVSPWDYKAIIPSFQNESDNFVDVVVVLRGDRTALESGTFLMALTSKINQANAAANRQNQNTQSHLNAVAEEYGMSATELDSKIREWGHSTKDPFEAGLVALYARDYSTASQDLTGSLQEREKKLASGQKAVADAAFFLGVSKYQEGKYRDSVAAYERCLQLRPNDPTVLNNLAQSVADSGDFARAQSLFEDALAIRTATLGKQNADTAQSVDSLALVLQSRGKYADAEARYREAMAIRAKVLGPYARETVLTTNSLAGVLYSEGRYQQSEELFRQVLSIREGENPNSLDTAQTLDSLALCLQVEKKFDEAEANYRRALDIRKKTLALDHPAIAQTENSLAWLLYSRGEPAEAKVLYESALNIRKSVLGPDHPLTASTMDGLGLVVASTNPKEGEALIRQALLIQEQKLGMQHPDTATSLDHLGLVLEQEGQWDAAEKSMEQALTIRERVLGKDHPETQVLREHIHELEQKKAASHSG